MFTTRVIGLVVEDDNSTDATFVWFGLFMEIRTPKTPVQKKCVCICTLLIFHIGNKKNKVWFRGTAEQAIHETFTMSILWIVYHAGGIDLVIYLHAMTHDTVYHIIETWWIN